MEMYISSLVETHQYPSRNQFPDLTESYSDSTLGRE